MQTTKPNKKLLSTVLVTLITLTLFSVVIPIASAVGTVGLAPGHGPVGTKVTVMVDDTTIGGLVKIYWDSVKDWDGTAGFLAEGYAIGSTATITIVIPEALAGDHYVIAKDAESGTSNYNLFTVDSKIVLTPDYGIIGDTITVKGTGFAKESPITLSGISGIVTIPTTVKTSALGSFTCTFKIPTGTVDDPYTITATDGVNSATDVLTVGKYITLSPKKGLVGSTVTITGRGFAPEGTVDIRWYMGGGSVTLVDDYPIDSVGDFSTTFEVPLVNDPTAPGVEYGVGALDSEDGYAEATFTVIMSATIKLDPKSGKADDTITITGSWFTPEKKVSFTFDTTTLATSPTPVYAELDGSFTCTFKVPKVAEDTYTVKATDEMGLTASKTFTVTVLLVEIRTRANEYLQGDIMSIYGNCSEAQDAVLLITDPNGVMFWATEIWAGNWMEIDDWFVLPYLSGSWLPLGIWHLPSDAPLGTWNFTAYDTWPNPDAEILDTNLFTVVSSPSIQMVLDRLDELDASITDLVTTSEGNILALVTTARGDILANLDELDAKIIAIDDAVATIDTALGTVKTSVDSIALKVTSIEGDVATIETTLGTIQGKVTSIDGTVATIKTDLGTVKTDVSSVKTTATETKTAADATKTSVASLTTIIYVAIALSLIAAIAAIFSVVQVSRKIAG